METILVTIITLSFLLFVVAYSKHTLDPKVIERNIIESKLIDNLVSNLNKYTSCSITMNKTSTEVVFNINDIIYKIVIGEYSYLVYVHYNGIPYFISSSTETKIYKATKSFIDNLVKQESEKLKNNIKDALIKIDRKSK